MKSIKSNILHGHKLYLSNATANDAEFIISLRTDATKNKYLSQTNADIEEQRSWLLKYQGDPMQAYFIINEIGGEKIGTVRIYDIIGDSFCWGSWILKNNAPSFAAIESALIVYSYGLKLGFTQAHFDVRKGNDSVSRFHERFGATIISDNEIDYFYNISFDAINKSLNKYRKYLPDGIKIY
ncbi:GNAT family N-acetyltransferase [Buttiauxella sp. B2]|uniref:GNAT family N-acetyltransferase n=1 Tax=Buttiauxella sp. B2 TaxID=2587812 RepID=UPI00167B70A0|nr:GNAT family N-acetyltransferase [Buttiauxella sp. B2]